MAVHKILKMGDPRLFRAVRPVTEFGTDTLEKLIADMYDTMRAAKGAGLAAPQIGVDLQVVVFGSDEPEGFHARVVQHECDHLSGILYPMRMRDFTQFGFTEVLFPEMDPDLDD